MLTPGTRENEWQFIFGLKGTPIHCSFICLVNNNGGPGHMRKKKLQKELADINKDRSGARVDHAQMPIL